MTRKAKVAQFLMNHDGMKISFDEWLDFQKVVPEIRLKKTSQGQILINLSGQEGFVDHKTWLANYRAGQMERVKIAIEDALQTLLPEDVNEVLVNAGLDEIIMKDSVELLRAKKVLKDAQKAFHSDPETNHLGYYLGLARAAKIIIDGKTPTCDMVRAVLEDGLD